jgi:hypothetical protein
MKQCNAWKQQEAQTIYCRLLNIEILKVLLKKWCDSA